MVWRMVSSGGSIRKLAKHWPELLRIDFGAFSIRLPSTEAKLAGDQDGSCLDVVIVNHLSCVRSSHLLCASY